jgi:hypothetical protein
VNNPCISDEFQIVCKTDIYKIPIIATILDEEKFNEINEESYKIHNKPATKPHVREFNEQRKRTLKEQLQKFEGTPLYEKGVKLSYFW